MAVSTIALYASPPSSVCSTPYPNSHPSYDFDLNGRSSSSPAQKPVIGGLSSLFSSSSTVKSGPAVTTWKDRPIGSLSSASYSSGGEGLGSLLHDRGEELSSSFCYSPYPSLGSSIKRDQSLGAALNKSKVRPCQSPISVFQGPVSCCSSSSSSGVGSSRSSPMIFARERDGDANLQGSIQGEINGFVQHTLGSCVNYDMLDVEVESSDLVEELTFNMEGNFTESNPEQYAKELLLGAQVRHKIFYDDVVIKAFYEAEKAHRGQMRASGDPYLQHCVETAVLLAMIGANSTVVAAGLLHDTLDDSFMCYDNIFQTFGAGVADLVEGVSKLSQLSKLARESNTASKKVEADRLHTMFLAMADARAVLVKLADRLHNMMTLDALPLSKQQRFAKETLEIFVPLANRLGIFSWKEQLENICFRYLNPDQHRELSSQLLKSFDEAKITYAVEKLEQALQDESISYHVLSGRHKSLYGIYRKMLKKKLTMDEIHDIHALRLIVENEEDCYKALRVVRQLWSEVPGKFKDYINHPKCNGYQSLHTVVSEGMGPLEVQIRTKEMHLQAEYGFAAHWRYKEGDCKHTSFVLRMVEWARWVLTWQCETMNRSSIGYADSMKPPCIFPSHSEDCPYSYKPYCGLDGPIFVIVIENDKMSVQEFSANSTVMDILERGGRGGSRWAPPYGFPVKEELRPTVNGAAVNDVTCALKMGDVVDLTPTIPDKSLTGYREEIRRMYDLGLSVSSTASKSMVGWRS